MRLHFQGTGLSCVGCQWPDVCRSDGTCWTAEAEEEQRQRLIRRSRSPFFVRTGGTVGEPIGHFDLKAMEAACVAAERRSGKSELREDARRRRERVAAEESVAALLAGRAIALADLMIVKRYRDLEDRINHGFRFEVGTDGIVRPVGTVSFAA